MKKLSLSKDDYLVLLFSVFVVCFVMFQIPLDFLHKDELSAKFNTKIQCEQGIAFDFDNQDEVIFVELLIDGKCRKFDIAFFKKAIENEKVEAPKTKKAIKHKKKIEIPNNEINTDWVK